MKLFICFSYYIIHIIWFRERNLSDSSDTLSSTSDEEEILKHRGKKLKTHQIEDRATSKFYTKDENHEGLPYVADNAYKVKKSKKNKYRTKFKSKGQSSFKVNIFLTVTNK